MNCISCAQTIEDMVSQQKSIKSARVYFPLNLLIVEHDERIKNITKQIGKKLKTSGYFIREINLDEILKQAKESIFNLLARLSFVLLLLALLHIPHSQFPFIQLLYGKKILFIFAGLVVLSFKYFGYLVTEIKGQKLGMGTFLSIAIVLTAFNYFINIYQNKDLITLKNILSSYAMILFFVEIGKSISELIRLKFFKEHLKSFQVLRRMVTIKKNGGLIEKMVKNVKENDIVLIKPGDTIYFDSKILQGSSRIDESIVTGEAEPVFKKENDLVYSGSQNLTSVLEIRVVNSFFKSYFGILHLYILQKLSEKSDTQQTLDKFLKFFIVVELLLIIIAILYHIKTGFIHALERAVTIALLSCPCAFGIAIPLVQAGAYLLSFKNNIIIKNPNVLETFKNVKYFILDKTGILTSTKQSIPRSEFFTTNPYFLNILYTLTKLTNHPKAVTLNDVLTKTYPNLTYIENVTCEEIIGKGFKCNWDGKLYFLGSYNLLLENFKRIDQLKEEQNKRGLYFFTPTEIIAIFDFHEEVIQGIQEIMSWLKKKYEEVVILSGDRVNRVKECADKLGVTTFYAEKTPIEKLTIIREYKKRGTTIFVGDGLNDALVLKESDIGISIGGATDLAKNSADVILLDNDLSGIKKLDKLSRTAATAIKTNIMWAIIYNTVFIPLGFGVFDPIHISPVIASILMSGSSILLTINSLLFLKLAR
ncbi:MAG: heavy metal translocating P-type ATPase [Planctomycetota bacterium]